MKMLCEACVDNGLFRLGFFVEHQHDRALAFDHAILWSTQHCGDAKFSFVFRFQILDRKRISDLNLWANLVVPVRRPAIFFECDFHFVIGIDQTRVNVQALSINDACTCGNFQASADRFELFIANQNRLDARLIAWKPRYHRAGDGD